MEKCAHISPTDLPTETTLLRATAREGLSKRFDVELGLACGALNGAGASSSA
ncbi:hypothetical protein WA016_08122 [Myxococcus stipitatus]